MLLAYHKIKYRGRFDVVRWELRFGLPANSSTKSDDDIEVSTVQSTVDYRNISDPRAKLFKDIKACAGGKCLKPVNDGSKNSTNTPDSRSNTEVNKQSTNMQQKMSPTDSTRQFDGWSFFGGIIVTVGTSAIAIVAFKYYQTKRIKNQNYNLM